jgi:hypothetical protein
MRRTSIHPNTITQDVVAAHSRRPALHQQMASSLPSNLIDSRYNVESNIEREVSNIALAIYYRNPSGGEHDVGIKYRSIPAGIGLS